MNKRMTNAALAVTTVVVSGVVLAGLSQLGRILVNTIGFWGSVVLVWIIAALACGAMAYWTTNEGSDND